MHLTGIDRIVYGVDAMAECVRFFTDWGLKPVTTAGDRAVFETLDGGEVVLRPLGAEGLPPAMETGATLRRVVWGVASDDDLAELRERISSLESFADEREGFGCDDPHGLRLSFRVSRRRPVKVAETPANTAGRIERVDQRGAVYERAEPVSIGHVVLFSPDAEAAHRFYVETLGFVLSDCYPGAGYFLRCAPAGGHHDLFLLQTPDRRLGLNHVAFTVRDIHEVFGGGLHVSRRGWKTQIGPGRHPISSAYFWYVHNPAGGLAEYFADEDYCTAEWKARAWERSGPNFAEWAITGGIDGETRRQAGGPG